MVTLGTAAAVLSTYLLLAVFLSVTAAVAVRNVLGSAPLSRAVIVGPVPATVAFLARGAELLLPSTPAVRVGVPFLAVGLAVLADAAVVRWAYDVEWRLAASVTFVHVVFSVLAGAALGGVLFLLSTAPG